ncbi:hypothetical protein JRQ81_010916 [Phrynocephalus forsythii]|uniref:ubiquitinyl hydrolase 1 n=1 Tax=Phrynocephalus forsythii TaxID=171643 RepID=A0A9Q0Y1I5_9SAUR|nr:hypothetical protein JRQ81_010916 [Phrynocephalus forsythii]
MPRLLACPSLGEGLSSRAFDWSPWRPEGAGSGLSADAPASLLSMASGGGRRETPTRSPAAAAAAAEGATEMNTAVMHPSCQFSQKDKNMYYILTDNHPYGSKLFPAGSICYLKEETFLRYLRMEFTRFWRFVMEDDGSVVTMDVENLLPLDEKVAAFLLAVSSARERLSSVLDSHLLEAAMKARVGQHVLVELNHQTFPGVLHYIGRLHKSPLPSGIFPVYFGVELESHGEGKGHCDGSYNGTEYFKCKPDCGIFLPFNKLQFLPVPENTKLEETEKLDGVEVMPVKVGDALGFYLDDALTRGIAMDVYKEGSTWMVKVCPEEDGAMDDFRIIPMDSVVKEELLSAAVELETDVGPQEQMKHKRNESAAEKGAKPSSLDVNSVVEINLEKGNSVTGTIRWIGCLPDTLEKVAGVELDEEKGFSDGEVQGVRYFTCPPKRGLFVRLESCQPDMRFQTDCHTRWEPSETSGLDTPVVTSNLPPLRDETAVKVLSGRMRGIQGHCNSCYMDAALFSLFSCTSVLDSMLYKPPFPPEAHVQRILRDKIVNPLRQNGFVPARSVMDLRYHLTEKGQCSSFATSEKDPEEFLNLIMHHIFGIEPLLKLQ